MPMQIALFGATGRTGGRVLTAAIGRGWSVNALTRSPGKLSPMPGLTIVPGELSDADALARTVAGTSAAIIALGTGSDLRATTALSDGTAHIVQALETAQVRRVVCLLSGWLFYRDVPPPFVAITHDHARQLALLQASTLDWVAVCPPALVDRPARASYSVTFDRLPGAGYQEIGVDDLAAYMLHAITDDTVVRRQVGIAD